MTTEIYEVVVVGGGPAGATAALELAKAGRRVALLDREGRIKPCGGAIPPKAVRDFAIPSKLLVARAVAARMIAPSGRAVDMPIGGDGYVGMVDREEFDEWLRQRAASAGACRLAGTFESVDESSDGWLRVTYHPKGSKKTGSRELVTRAVIGADGAKSAVASAAIGEGKRTPCVFAYHEIVRSPTTEGRSFNAHRCDVYYQGRLSQDFYGWVFPHGPLTSIGAGSAIKGANLRTAVSDLRRSIGMDRCDTIRREGAPIPLRPLKRWDNGRNIVVVGDAAGIVAPASGEGIYYAMVGGRLAAEAVAEMLETGKGTSLAKVRQRFMREHGWVFWSLGWMQYFWYANDQRRERFVSLSSDPDIQRLTWDAYMNKRMPPAGVTVHSKIFFKDLMHLLGMVPP